MELKAFFDKHIGGDRVIWAVLILLSLISIVVVYSATGSLAYKVHHGNTLKMLFSQIFFSVLGLSVVFISHKFSYKFYMRMAGWAYLGGIGLLAATLVMGASLNEGGRWLAIPGTGLMFQPSEFAKVALMMLLARELAIYQNGEMEERSAFLRMLAYIMIAVGLIFRENFSTAAMVFVVSMALLFVGRIGLKYIIATIAAGVAVMVVLLLLSSYVPQLHRLSTWKARLERFGSNEKGIEGNYQSEQAKIAVVTGGVTGKGPGNSTQKNFLPHPYSDFVFAIIVEEYGIFGAIFTIMLYLILAFRMGKIVKECQSAFPALLVTGLTILFLVQSFINMGVSVGILPVTGQTLPLVSKGGTSILFTSLGFGAILSVSRYLEEQKIKGNSRNTESEEAIEYSSEYNEQA